MAFKLLSVCLLVALLAISSAQAGLLDGLLGGLLGGGNSLGGTQGGSKGGSQGGSGGLLSGVLDKVVEPLQQVAVNLVSAIQLLGEALSGEISLPAALEAILNRVVIILCNVLNLVNNLLAAMGGNVSAISDFCPAAPGVTVPAGASTAGLGI